MLRPTRRHLNHLHTAEHNHTHLVSGDARLLHWHYTEFDDHNFQIHGQTLFYLFILFSIILIVTLLLLYARWYFRFRHLRATGSAAHAAAPLQRGAAQCLPRGLDPSVINSFCIILHQSAEVKAGDKMECCICLGVFEDGDKVKVLPRCQHRYHSECVDRWLMGHSSCPLCRVSLRVDPPPPPVADTAALPPV